MVNKLSVKQVKQMNASGVRSFTEEKFIQNYRENSIYKDEHGYYSFTTGGRKRYDSIEAIKIVIGRAVTDGWPSSCDEWKRCK